jgi:hypothetical protein
LRFWAWWTLKFFLNLPGDTGEGSLSRIFTYVKADIGANE